MKQALSLVLLCIIVSCSSSRKSGSSKGGELFITRKYVGDFIEYRYTKPAKFGKPHLIWIKTTQDSIYGKISAYSRKCEFKTGDRLYIRRVYPLIRNGYWDYYIENDDENKVWYKATILQHDKKAIINTWF